MTTRNTQETRSSPAPRLGPRPLPLHLMAAALAWTGSRAALPLLKNGSLPWRPEVRARAAALESQIESVDPETFAQALDAESRARWRALIDGILAYRHHAYRRDLADPPTVWREGTTRLLDYGATSDSSRDGAPVLFVPSLINRAYILDLAADMSLMRWLTEHGMRPFLVDWDRPGPIERGFTLTDYIAGRLEGALDAVHATTGRRPVVVGYCMGGLLALALALRRHGDVAGLGLLATPWDFHTDGGGQGALAASALLTLGPVIDFMGELPLDAIQGLFASLDPQLVARKFLTFGRLDPASPKAARFVALEDWLNDGVPLAAPVARECLGGWYAENAPALGHWRIAGSPVDPGRLRMPCFNVIPGQDRIVPPASARALARAVPGADAIEPTIGHIGMMVSAHARAEVWRPLADWLAKVVAARAAR